MKRIGILLIALAMIPQVTFAADQLLATITRLSDGVKSTLTVRKDDRNDARSFVFKIFEEDGTLDKNINIEPSELTDGKVVLSKMGIDVISISSENFAEHNGGHITITYLKKWKLIGSNQYAKYEVLLEREGDNWMLQRQGKTFNELKAIDHSKGIHRFEIVK